MPRERPQATPTPRDRPAESVRARRRALAALALVHPSTAMYKFTTTVRGTPTTLYEELSKGRLFELTPKPPAGSAESLATRKARRRRWGKDRAPLQA